MTDTALSRELALITIAESRKEVTHETAEELRNEAKKRAAQRAKAGADASVARVP